jgi:hypothetical protein
VGVVDEPVEDGVGDGRVGDHLVPVIDRQLAGHDGRAAIMPIVDDLQQIATLILRQGCEPPVVEDQELDAGQRFEQTPITTITARQRQSLEQPRHALIKHGAIVAAGLVAERTGKPALADTGRASVMLPGVWVLRWRSSTRFILGAVKVWVFSAASNTGAKSISSSDSRMAH